MPQSDTLLTVAVSTLLSGGFTTALVTYLSGRRDARLKNTEQKAQSQELSFSRLERENARQALRIQELEKKLEAAEAREDAQREEVRKLKNRLDDLSVTLRKAQRESAECRAELQKIQDSG